VDALKRGVAEEEAATIARNIAFDYNDLTDFEKAYARKAVMFYAFQRRNQDLFWRTLLTHPERLTAELRLLSGLQRANLGEDSELYVSPMDEGRLVLDFREPLESGHLQNAQQGAMTLTPALNIGSQVGLYLDVLGPLSQGQMGGALRAMAENANPVGTTLAGIAGGNDPETGRPYASSKQTIPDNIVWADYQISNLFKELDDESNGGMLVNDIFRARPVQPWDDIESEQPGALVWEVDRSDPVALNAWIAFKNMLSLYPMATTERQIDRFIPGGLSDPRVGVTEAGEFGKWLGFPTNPVSSRVVKVGRDIESREAELLREAKEAEAGSATSGRGE
jgi:hypothetical protein